MPMCRPSAAGRWNVEDTPGEVRTASRLPSSAPVAARGVTRLGAACVTTSPAGRPVACQRPAAWLLLALATLLWALGSLYWAWAVDIAYVPPQPSPADVMYLVAYPVLAGSLFLIGRRRRAKGDLPSLLDAMIVVSVVALVVWVLVLDPTWVASGGASLERLVSTAYPVFDLVVAMQLTFVWVTGTRRPPALASLLGAVTVLLVTDALYQVSVYLPAIEALNPWLDGGWLLGALLWGVAALHPSMVATVRVESRSIAAFTVGRVVAIGVAFAVVPTLTLVAWLLHLPSPTTEVQLVNVLLVVLVVLRMVNAVTTVRRQAVRLAHLADSDFVTGIDNRRRFSEQVEESLGDAAVARPWRGSAVLLVGLERFTEVNEMLGHQIGDELLRTVASTLRDLTGHRAGVARIGSDVFGVLECCADADEAMALAERIRDTLARPLSVEGLGLIVEAAVGVVDLPGDACDADQVLARADAALSAARGCATHVMRYTAALDDRGAAPRLLGELRGALDDGDIIVHFQPQVDVATGRVVGAEALVRWRHPDRGVILPGEFIPVAERSALIRPLTLVVLDQALAECAAWAADGLDLSVAVNLSVRNLLDPNLVADVQEVLARHGVPAYRLDLEITETMAMVDPVRAAEVLSELAGLGVTLSVDDYGTGYGSLAYLQRLPVRRLKIDRSFVAGLTADESSAAIVRSTIDLARRLGLWVVAEGVEDLDTLVALRDMRCDAAQGFGLSRPVAAADLRAAVDRIERTVPKLLGASMGVPRSRGALAASGVCPIGVVDA